MSDTPRDLELAATLARVEDKLDRVLAAQRWTDDLIAEMTPVAREVIRAGGVTLGDLEARGYFAVGAELLALVDRVIAAYGPGEVRQLAEHVVAILDTVRHLTQPDLLAAVNEAGDLVQRADEVRPVGVFGAVAATRDEEVQRGLGVAVELLRHLGRRRE
ncbi:MAG TPA: DUF1641 domain-containing protein, partial [Myxococcota bacterium]|nr:DUF1641 domain-containing protein [Myxococcota bacterium]